MNYELTPAIDTSISLQLADKCFTVRRFYLHIGIEQKSVGSKVKAEQKDIAGGLQ